MKKSFIGLVVMIFLLGGLPLKEVLASEEVIFIGNPEVSEEVMQRNALAPILEENLFESKTDSEREALPESEQEVINSIEAYIQENTTNQTRNFGPVLNKLIAGLAFEIAFKRENTVINITNFFGLTTTKKQSVWFDGLTNKSDRYMTVFDEPTNQNVELHAYYVDNQSNKTAVVHHGYRSQGMNIMDEAEFLSSLGYNVLIPDARSHGASQGSYITFGAYEKNDLNLWLDDELAKKPNQEFILLGVSMGAATVMMSQEIPHKNVKAIIEDCGYYSMEQQARDVMRLLTSRLQYIPLVNQIDWYECEDELIVSLNDNFIKPQIKVDLTSISPLEAVKKSGLPKLFIHGSADWFIPPVAKTKLYNASLGYKEQLEVVGSGHAENLQVGGDLYKNKVSSFLNTVDSMVTKAPFVAETVNLLVNPLLAPNDTLIGINSWNTSGNSRDFSEAVYKNGEYIVFKNSTENLSTITPTNNKIRFYNKWENSAGYIGQDIETIKDEEYELSFNVQNPNPLEFSEQVIRYGFNSKLQTEEVLTQQPIQKKVNLKAENNGNIKVILGAEMSFYNLFGRKYTRMDFSNIALVNTDSTPPTRAELTSVITNFDGTVISGRGEANTAIKVLGENDEVIIEVMTNEKGFFEVSIPKQMTGTVLHLINQDVKGNQSASTALVSY